MTTYKKYMKIKAYSYDGFSKPELLAKSINGLLTNVLVSHEFLGNATKEMKEIVVGFKKGLCSLEDLKEELEYYNIYINPSYNELVEASKTWFGNDIPFYHFVEFRKEW